MELLQNWDNQSPMAKSFQMRYNLSELNNQNYQTLILLLQGHITKRFCIMYYGPYVQKEWLHYVNKIKVNFPCTIDIEINKWMTLSYCQDSFKYESCLLMTNVQWRHTSYPRQLFYIRPTYPTKEKNILWNLITQIL